MMWRQVGLHSECTRAKDVFIRHHLPKAVHCNCLLESYHRQHSQHTPVLSQLLAVRVAVG